MMETDETNNLSATNYTEATEDPTTVTAINSSILNYYKKFGKKRDLEQYFSLSTAQNEIQDTNSLFWKQMKSQNDSSDSGGRKSSSSNELCRISIKCSVQEPSTSQDDRPPRNSDTESPPIITDDTNIIEKLSDNVSVKSDDNHSQKSHDEILDSSMNKPLSPTSSVTSQRKLEWDSLADVGYANESDRKASGSSLSTLERLALRQQFSNNDTKCDMGIPTAHSTPLEQNENIPKAKKQTSKLTKVYRKDVDFVEFNMPQDFKQSPPQAFNVNLTKHISFNVDKNGGVSFKDPKSNVAVDKVSVETEVTPLVKIDREIQTSLLKLKKSDDDKGDAPCVCDRKPVLPVSLSTLRKKNKRKKKLVRKKSKGKSKNYVDKKKSTTKPKSMEQVSEAESFEYMPGHIYNQNQLRQEQEKSDNTPLGNKSSLESSAIPTTDSSKGSKTSFTKDLDKSVKLLQQTLQGHSNYSNIKKKLISEVVERLLKTKYKDDESSTDFLSGLSYSSQKLGLGKSHHTMSSTSDGNTDGDTKKPKKSILRVDKFNPNVIASSSQSAPNLPVATNSDIPILPNMSKPKELTTTTTETDTSKEKLSVDTVYAKTSSTELYKQYLEALKRETAHKKFLYDKERFLKQKLVNSDVVLNPDIRIHNRIKDLMKDLTRNNYDDGSGDASKLEGGVTSHIIPQNNTSIRRQRSHSVFTLSSGQSDNNNKKHNLKKKLKLEISSSTSTSNNEDQGCKCVSRGINHRIEVCDSSVQVNMKTHDNNCINLDKLQVCNLKAKQLQPITDAVKNIAHIVSDDQTGDIKYVCLCPSHSEQKSDEFLIYKCSRLDTDKSNNPLENQGKVRVRSPKICLCQPSTSKASENQCSNCRLILLQERSSESTVESIPKKSDYASTTTCCNICIPQYKNIAKNNIKIATRCLQTEISINPKIPEAQLSDVVYVEDIECATLVNDVVSEVPSNQSHIDSDISATLGKCLDKRSKLNEYERFSKIKEKGIRELPKIEEQDQKSNISSPRNPDNFTIPITGTNVSLLVSVSCANDKISTKEMCTQGTTTSQRNVCDKSTCPDECTKGVQSETSQLFTQINKFPSMCTELSSDNNVPTPCSSKTKFVSVCQFNTHPKTIRSDMNMKTPLIRSNTDPGKFVCTPSQVYSVYPCESTKDTKTVLIKKDVETQFGCVGVATQKSEGVLTSLPQSDRQIVNSNYEVPKSTPIVNTSRESPNKRRDTDSTRSSRSDRNDLKLRLDITDQQVVSSSSSSYLEYKSQTRLSKLSKKKDPVIHMIKDLTKRYSKEDYDKRKKMKTLKEFVSVLNYLVDTEENTEVPECTSSACVSPTSKTSKIKTVDKGIQLSCRIESRSDSSEPQKLCSETCQGVKKVVDKSVQLSPTKCERGINTKNLEQTTSTDMPYSSTDTTTGDVLNKIKKECERYQQKRCRCSHHCRECTSSSSCDCNRTAPPKHICVCKSHKSQHRHKSSHEKPKKKYIAYNLILQTSDSVSEDFSVKNHNPALKNIVVKVPPKKKSYENIPFNEMASKFDKKFSPSECMAPPSRSDNIPFKEVPDKFQNRYSPLASQPDNTSSDDTKRHPDYTVGDYLKTNRPDFVENCSQRQNCLKIISERRSDPDRCSPPRMVVIHTPKCMGNCCMHNCGGPGINCFPCFNPFTNFDNEVKRIDTNTILLYEKTMPFIVYKTAEFDCLLSEIAEICGFYSNYKANERASKRKLLSMQLDQRQVLSELSENELRSLARQLGVNLRAKKDLPKFMSEKEMKQHSYKIYKSLPEVVKKKEEKKKENNMKTNLLMADIFNKNLQKKTLKGDVNISNYSSLIKI